MAEIVNLRLVRKRKQREDAQAVAANNRLTHGQSRADKRLNETQQAARQRHLDGHKREKPDEK